MTLGQIFFDEDLLDSLEVVSINEEDRPPHRYQRIWHTSFSRFRRETLAYKANTFFHNWKLLREYKGHMFYWTPESPGSNIRIIGICDIPVMQYDINLSQPILIEYPHISEVSKLVDFPALFRNHEEFYNRMRLLWRRLGVPAVRYKEKTKIISPITNETLLLSPGDKFIIRTDNET